jgi:two-component system, NarL family, response regulator DevR
VFDDLGSSSAEQHSPIKLLVADDSKVVRRGICQLLACYSGIEVVAEAASFAQTIELANGLDPRVIVIDLHMPDEAEFTPPQFKANLNKGSLLLAMSLRNDKEAEELAQSFGAAMLLDKAELGKMLIPSIVRFASI